jgi:hypothetical protein
MLVCPSCFGDSDALKARFKERGSIGTCPTCGDKGVTVLDASELSDLFGGLKAHYEPLTGDEYRLGKNGIYGFGPDTGDESLVEILRDDWEVFSDRVDDEHAEDILRSVWPGYVGEYQRDGSQTWRQVCDEWENLKRSLMHEWRFFHRGRRVGEGVGRLLDPWVEALGTSLITRTWKRARRQESRNEAFGPHEMGAPPPHKARAGRANPPGIPHLYVASDAGTGVAEIGAEPGDWVTIATVEIQCDSLPVLDLTRDVRVVDPFGHDDLHEALMLRELLQVFSYELSRPVRSTDHEIDYVVTQFLSEYFRAHGFGGIVYSSSVADGTNAVFFDPSIGEVSNCVQREVWSKSVDVVDEREFERRERGRRGLPW